MATVSSMPPMLRLQRSLQSGIKIMTAAWQVVYTESSIVAFLFSGAEIDLSVMAGVDAIDIRVRKRLTDGGAWVVHDQAPPYVGTQPVNHPTVHIAPLANTYGIEIAMRQTAGVLRSITVDIHDAKRLGLA